ncbi:cytochrome B [Pelagivirga sediminicola]|uniref:Cytochrome B n=1 Tax=Pelagivirga sediminicola TaxID=2170575 RepID=A0A2T7G882_9RHOB|nr:cytochrome b [Pelagivirga sediminicola]PVA10625.1 cytochrome B [Pelagivirga sediminicola]
MATLYDSPDRYGLITRILHWGMAVLFAAQFLSAALHWALPREHPVRDFFWSYHYTLGTTLFLLVLLRGIWGLANLRRRPVHFGLIGRAAAAGHLAIYVLMVVVPTVRLVAAAGDKRGFSYLGIPIFPARETDIGWLKTVAEWHGEMGWILAFLVLGHIVMAVGWHHLIKRDGSLKRMAG